jgi:L,D-transpeptidase ErfK/SrfK
MKILSCGRGSGVAVALLLAGGCALAPAPTVESGPALVGWPELERADYFEGVTRDTQVVGRLQVVAARDDDTFTDIGRRFNLGYEELRAANPGIDPWLPGEGREIVLPTAHVIPDAPREGIVINLPAMRLWWFGPPDAAGRQTVITHPIGIGKLGWATPVGEFTIISKAKDPNWVPPASVRREHEKAGDPLPAVVPPGPDNPLGRHALRLSLPSYLIHGTNKPAGVGLRASHGCIRLYPEDIEALFDRLPTGTKVRMIDQPWLAGWQDGQLLFEAHGNLEDGHGDWTTGLEILAERAGEDRVDWARAAAINREGMGAPLPVGAGSPAPPEWLALAPRVENRARGNFRETEPEQVARAAR